MTIEEQIMKLQTYKMFEGEDTVYVDRDDVLKILEQKSCEDCISREWLKTAIHNFYHGLRHIPTEEDIQVYIDVAPPVTPQPKIDTWSIKEVADTLEKHGLIKEQEPCEDAVSRQALYEWLDGWKEKNKYYHPHTKNEIIPICEVIDIIQSLPSVTPQPKTRQRLCRTCIYGDKTEYDKPCIIYSDNCQLYKAKILDKIRAEIAEAWENEPCATEHGCLDEILQIIDKAESEGE